MACALYMYNICIIDVIVHSSHSTEKRIVLAGFELVMSGLAMEGLITAC